MPAIVYFEESGIASGRFLLFLAIANDEARVALIDGSYVTRVQMSGEEFRRRWAGYALIARSTSTWRMGVHAIATTMVAGGVAFCFVLLSAPRRPSGRRPVPCENVA